MPTRKQKRKRQQKFRHEQAWYEVDEFGNEIELDPAEVKTDAPEKRTNGAKPAAKKAPQRSGRPVRTPPVPSWGRAVRRGGMLGAVVLVLFSLTAKGNLLYPILSAVVYTALFVPFTFWIDRLAYRRWQAKEAGGTSAKKR